MNTHCQCGSPLPPGRRKYCSDRCAQLYQPSHSMAGIVPTEEQEMHTLCDWLRAHRLLFAHPANEGMHKPQYRRKQAVLGLQPGLPDILVFDPPPKRSGVRGVAIELKCQRGGTVSDAQIRWIEGLRERGWIAFVAVGAGRAIEELERLGYGKRTA